MRRQENRKDEKGLHGTKLLIELLKGGAIGFIAAVAALLLSSEMISSGLMPIFWLNYITLIACFLGSFVGGFCVLFQKGKGRLWTGTMTGCIMALLLMAAGMLMYEEVTLENGGSVVFCICLLGGTAAGFMRSAIGTRKKRR